jgi:GDPmannose 4,6-dehydratase
LITGITGQDGSYLAELLLSHGHSVIGLVRDASAVRLQHIGPVRDRITLVEGSLLDAKSLEQILDRYRPGEVYNFAARASSRHLFADPVLTCEVNGLAVARLLEAIRTVDPAIRFCQASSSEMFGNSTESPQNERTPFRPRNPYGVAKLFAHGMVATYRQDFGLFACSAILFNHESPRRGPEFVTKKIANSAARIKAGHLQTLPMGDLEATRDWGYAADYVRGMRLALQAQAPDDYIFATGESHSVREFCDAAFAHLGMDYRDYVSVSSGDVRPPEVVRLVGDATRARTALGWSPSVSFRELVGMMVDAELRDVERGLEPAPVD